MSFKSNAGKGSKFYFSVKIINSLNQSNISLQNPDLVLANDLPQDYKSDSSNSMEIEYDGIKIPTSNSIEISKESL